MSDIKPDDILVVVEPTTAWRIRGLETPGHASTKPSLATGVYRIAKVVEVKDRSLVVHLRRGTSELRINHGEWAPGTVELDITTVVRPATPEDLWRSPTEPSS